MRRVYYSSCLIKIKYKIKLTTKNTKHTKISRRDLRDGGDLFYHEDHEGHEDFLGAGGFFRQGYRMDAEYFFAAEVTEGQRDFGIMIFGYANT